MQYGRYQIVRELGKGSMGVVYEAYDPLFDRRVALKVLRPDRVSSSAFAQRFLKEAKAVGRLYHSNIVVAHDKGEDHGTVYLSMEYIEGKPLNEVLQTEKLALEEALKIGIQIADALAYAHSKGIVHRDIKPSNIIVQPDGNIKITDFGIARIEDPLATQQTQAGEILGTPAYMAPEQVLGRSVDGRSDLFSLGVILYELATRQRPFSGESLATIFHSITHEDPRNPEDLNPGLPRELSAVILKCLSKEPEHRYSSCHELSEALRSCLLARDADTVTITPAAAEPRRVVQLLPMILLTLILVAGLSAGAIYLMRGPSRESALTQPPQTPQSLPGQNDRADSPSFPASTSSTATPADPAHPPETPSHASEQLPTTASSAPSTSESAKPGQTPSAQGSLRLESKPVGAEVRIDGEYRGQTPLEVTLPPGAHEVRLTLPDHGDWEAQVKVAENRVTHIPAELLRIQ
jgi:serine/threonine-protein kinase